MARQAKQMTVEELEAKRSALAAEQKQLTKELRRAKAYEKAEAERKARAEEQAKALEFYRYVKSKSITYNDGRSETVYEYIKKITHNPDL